jgi:cellulose biosynthesis protein BcsQ
MRRVIFNQKGGAGKSTIGCNLAAISASQGARMLVIDLDPQGNSSQYLLGGGRGTRSRVWPHSIAMTFRAARCSVLENVQEIQHDHNSELTVEGIVINQFQPRASLPQQLVQKLLNEGLPVLSSYLSQPVKIRESHQHARPMIYLEPRHKLAREYLALHQELNG